jgi:hypothetical protein
MPTFPVYRSTSSQSGLGLSRARPARRAQDMRGEVKKNGVYWIQPTGSASPLQVYCDMETDDGGWMLAFTCFPRISSCYVAGAVGGIPTPFDVSMNKFADSVIQNMLNDGERISRTFWFHTQEGGTDVFADGNIRNRGAQWNEFTNPFAWTSTDSSSGQTFRRRWGGETSWSGLITSGSTTGCSGAVGGWSNYYEQSCVQSWFASCEGGPAINHCCACPIDRAERLLVWVR